MPLIERRSVLTSRKELELKLVKQKRSIPVIVVDHVDEKPIK
jgi:uncharacterized protein (TIGR03435 family)